MIKKQQQQRRGQNFIICSKRMISIVFHLGDNRGYFGFQNILRYQIKSKLYELFTSSAINKLRISQITELSIDGIPTILKT